ncbi:MAG TPA: PspC domain-containing protein [Candidatus Butyricicoccus stercorigallinarum]|nr:PspC domain-containing protein [Candidatus Butyricicoccus stercorigallinarum]
MEKKLYRIEQGKMLCGVCMGISDYLDIDVTVIRLLFAALTVCSAGTGLLLYGAAAIIMPVKPA